MSIIRKENKMKTTIAVVLTLALVAVSGCKQSSPQGGESEDARFKISTPSVKKVKQGEVQTATVSLKRGDYFKQDVELQIKTTTGISIEPTKFWIKASDKPDVQLRITAAKDAALGEYRVFVKGTPETGEPTSAEFNVKVVAP